MKVVVELGLVYAQIVLKFLHSARLGWSDILCTVNTLARAVTKWTRAGDQRLVMLTGDIHFTKDYPPCGMLATKLTIPSLFRDATCVRDLHASKSTPGGVLCMLGDQTLVPMSWMCKKQPAVSHSTEAEATTLEAELRMEGLPALICFMGICCRCPLIS